MSYKLTLEQFENINLFSNRNMEKVMTGIINSSSNAALVNMGEDSVIILDHTQGDFYIADYEFNRKKLVVEFKNFEKIDLISEESEFENDVRDVFESEEDIDFTSLAESYRKNVSQKNSFLNDLVSHTMSRKPFNEDANYEEIKEAVSETLLESSDRRFFQDYKERLEKYPLMEVKRFDFQNPVKVSLVETERKKLVNESSIKKAGDLWKKEKFSGIFKEAAEALLDDVNEGSEVLKNLLEEYPQVMFLDAADRKALFGKTLLGISSLREEMDDILKGIDILFEKGELKDFRNKFLAEAEEEMEDEEPVEDEDEYSDDESYEPAPEVESDDTESLVDDLTRIMNKCEDFKTKAKLEDLIDRLSKGIEEGTRPDLVKEAVAILSL